MAHRPTNVINMFATLTSRVTSYGRADGVFQKAWCEKFRNLITSVSITTTTLFRQQREQEGDGERATGMPDRRYHLLSCKFKAGTKQVGCLRECYGSFGLN